MHRYNVSPQDLYYKIYIFINHKRYNFRGGYDVCNVCLIIHLMTTGWSGSSQLLLCKTQPVALPCPPIYSTRILRYIIYRNKVLRYIHRLRGHIVYVYVYPFTSRYYMGGLKTCNFVSQRAHYVYYILCARQTSIILWYNTILCTYIYIVYCDGRVFIIQKKKNYAYACRIETSRPTHTSPLLRPGGKLNLICLFTMGYTPISDP